MAYILNCFSEEKNLYVLIEIFVFWGIKKALKRKDQIEHFLKSQILFVCTAVVRFSRNLFLLLRIYGKIKEQNLRYSFSVSDTNSKEIYPSLLSFSGFVYILTQFLRDQRENTCKSQHQSSFHWLCALVYALFLHLLQCLQFRLF